MANDNSIGPGGLLVAFIAGAVTGAAVALLFAPAPGEETCDLLNERAREGRNRAAEAARKGRDLLAKQRENVSNAFEKGRDAYQAAREKEQDA
jgi:gas vesicle protein